MILVIAVAKALCPHWKSGLPEALCPHWKTGLPEGTAHDYYDTPSCLLDVQFLGWGVGDGITEKDPVKTGFYPCTVGSSPSRDLAGSVSGAEASLITLKGAP